MNINELERRMRQAFRKEEVSVDTDELWSSIEGNLPPTDRKKAGLNWKAFLGVFLFLFIGGIGYLTLNNNNINESIYNTDKALTYQENIGNNHATNPSSYPNTLTTENRISNESSIENNEQLNAALNVSTDEVNISKSVQNLIAKSTTATGRTEWSNQSNTADNDRMTTRQNFKRNQKNTLESVYENPSDFQLTTGTQGANTNSSFTSADYAGSALIMKEEAQSTNWSGQTQNTNMGLSASLPFSQKESTLESDEEYQFLQGNIWTKEIEKLMYDSPITLSPSLSDKHPFWIEREPKYFIEIGTNVLQRVGGISLENQDWSDHFNNRSAAEKNLVSIGFDIKAGYHLTPNWRVHTGIARSSYYKSTSAVISTTENFTMQNGVVQEIIGQNNTREIRGEVQGVRMTSSTVKRINNYTYLHIPLGISWTESAGILDYNIGIEGRLGMNASYSGFLHSDLSKEYDLTLDEANWYKSTAPHFIVISGGLYYPLSDVISIGIDAQYYHQLGKINTTSYGISENISGIGLRTGIHFKI